MIKDLKYIKFNSANPLDLIFSKVNWYFKAKQIISAKLVPTNENKEKKNMKNCRVKP